MPSFLEKDTVKQHWKDRYSLPIIRGMESREHWLSESQEIVDRLDEFGELLERNPNPLTKAFVIELLGLMAYLHSGYALRIVSFFDEHNPEFAQILIDLLQQMKDLDADIALHVMASRIRCLKNMKVLSTVFSKERISMVVAAVNAVNATQTEGES